MNKEFIRKMIQGKKLELEAFSLLLPKPMQEHGKIISKELKEMVVEMAAEVMLDSKMEKRHKTEEHSSNVITKITIE